MPALHLAVWAVRRWLPAILCTSGLCAQTCLVLSPAAVSADGTAVFDLALHSPRGKAPAAIQWTFAYTASNVSSLAVEDGTALKTSLKTAICAGAAGVYNCVAAGLNRRAIVNGIIARVTAVLAPGSTTAVIQITNSNAASPGGSPIPVAVSVQPPTGPDLSSDCRTLSQPGSLADKR